MELVRKDNNGGIRVAIIDMYRNGISRATGLLSGTMTEQPDIIIYAGKAGRSLQEQIELEYRALVSNYKDKGYKDVKQFNVDRAKDLTADSIKAIQQDILKDSNDVPRVMLAKTAPDKHSTQYNKKWYASYKIDGVRCTLRYDATEHKILTASRGGKHFAYSTEHLTTDPLLLELFREQPNLVLDGELYIHGKPLQFLQGLAKMKYFDKSIHEALQFYIFDLVSDDPFDDRLLALTQVRIRLDELAADAMYYDLFEHIRFVEHTPIKGYTNIMNLHDEALGAGYEGLVLRDPFMPYGYGSRDWRMIKVKVFEDDEFTIIGMAEGRRDEDMVFKLLAHNGKEFEAKPVGTRAIREQYGANIDSIIGKKGCVKYFGYSTNGIPNLPIFKYVRELR